MHSLEPADGHDTVDMRKNLESLEVEAPDCRPSEEVYAKLLAFYLEQNELCSAKFLWKRIPSEVKSSSPELNKIWAVGQALWKRDQPGTFQALSSYQWSDRVKDLMINVGENTRRRHMDLVSSAYSSISLSDFSNYVGLSEEEAKQLAISQDGWVFDDSSRMVLPSKKKPSTVRETPSEKQIGQLTDFISFLEK